MLEAVSVSFYQELLYVPWARCDLWRFGFGAQHCHNLRHVYAALASDQRLRHEQSAIHVRRVCDERAVSPFDRLNFPEAIDFFE